jgi:hypothetical protein
MLPTRRSNYSCSGTNSKSHTEQTRIRYDAVVGMETWMFGSSLFRSWDTNIPPRIPYTNSAIRLICKDGCDQLNGHSAFAGIGPSIEQCFRVCFCFCFCPRCKCTSWWRGWKIKRTSIEGSKTRPTYFKLAMISK